MQLCDVMEETDALDEVIKEIEFQKHLKELSELPKWKRAELVKGLDYEIEDLSVFSDD